MQHYDVVVIGVGSVGASAAWQLAKVGKSVLAIEQFDIVHSRGSHFGQTRIIRKAYFEHSDYVPLLNRAYELWRNLEEEVQSQLYWETGLSYYGLPKHATMEGVMASARKYTIPLQWSKSGSDQVFDLPKQYIHLFEPEAGFIACEKAIRSQVNLSMKYGAELRTNERVLNLESNGKKVVVITDKGGYEAGKVVVTAGAYTSQLLNLPLSLTVTRQILGWAQSDNLQFELGNFPCWMVIPEIGEGLYYGFPSVESELQGPVGMKFAFHKRGGELIMPSEDIEASQIEKEELMEALRFCFKDKALYLDSLHGCRYTYSPDEHFVVDALPEYNHHVIVVAGLSGHGFKFSTVLGEMISYWALDKTYAFESQFLRLSRFKK